MATYINYGEGEEDAVVQGAEWLRSVMVQLAGASEADQKAADGKFANRWKELHEESETKKKSYYGPVFDFFVDHSEDLFNSISKSDRPEERVKELESFYALVMNILTNLEDEAQINPATRRLCEVFSNGTLQAELRLRLLMMLYNTYNNPVMEQRHWIFKYIIDYAAKASLFDQVLPYLEYLDAWMEDWEGFLTVDDKRKLFKDIATYMRDIKKRLDAFMYLKKYHLLCQGEDKKVTESEEVQAMTVLMLTDAISLPSVIQFDDILSYDTVKALGKDKKHADLVKLCEIFLSGGVNDLKAFHDKNKKLFEEHKLNFDDAPGSDAMSKIRLLTLATLVHGRPEISLEEVASELSEEKDKVEQWVVRAISEGVIDGRIDQLNHKVLVKSSFQRKFEKAEWGFLDSKLTQWIDNLENVIKFIGEQKSMREGIN